MRIEVNAKGSRRYECRTGTGLLGWKTTNSTFVTLSIKEAPKSTCGKSNYEHWYYIGKKWGRTSLMVRI